MVPTSTKSPTDTPKSPSVLFIPPPDDPYNVHDPVRSTLLKRVTEDGWNLVEKNELTESDITSDIKAVIFFETTPDILDQIASHPAIHFIGLGIEGLQPQSNLSIIGPQGFRLDQQAFLGGYLAAVITQDWRIGNIIDIPAEYVSTFEVGFRNGMRFYCGLCLMSFPPFNDYPIQTIIDDTQSGWDRSVETLDSNAVETVFLITQDFELEAISRLIDSGVLLIGVKTPPDVLLSRWIATIRFAPDMVIDEKWEEIITMEGGWIMPIPLLLEDVNTSLFSEGKQNYLVKIIEDLQSGFIDPAVTPPAPAGNE